MKKSLILILCLVMSFMYAGTSIFQVEEVSASSYVELLWDGAGKTSDMKISNGGKTVVYNGITYNMNGGTIVWDNEEKCYWLEKYVGDTEFYVDHWSTKADSSGKNYDDDYISKTEAKSIKQLYAIWIECEVYDGGCCCDDDSCVCDEGECDCCEGECECIGTYDGDDDEEVEGDDEESVDDEEDPVDDEEVEGDDEESVDDEEEVEGDDEEPVDDEEVVTDDDENYEAGDDSESEEPIDDEEVEGDDEESVDDEEDPMDDEEVVAGDDENYEAGDDSESEEPADDEEVKLLWDGLKEKNSVRYYSRDGIAYYNGIYYHLNCGLLRWDDEENWYYMINHFADVTKYLDSWNTQKDGSGKRYDSKPISAKEANSIRDLYAVWYDPADERFCPHDSSGNIVMEKPEKFTDMFKAIEPAGRFYFINPYWGGSYCSEVYDFGRMKYSANGGVVQGYDGIYEFRPWIHDPDECEPLHFKHWNTRADDSGTTYMPGDTIKIDEDFVNDNLTLYAIWEKDDPVIEDKEVNGENEEEIKEENEDADVKSGGTGEVNNTAVNNNTTTNNMNIVKMFNPPANRYTGHCSNGFGDRISVDGRLYYNADCCSGYYLDDRGCSTDHAVRTGDDNIWRVYLAVIMLFAALAGAVLSIRFHRNKSAE